MAKCIYNYSPVAIKKRAVILAIQFCILIYSWYTPVSLSVSRSLSLLTLLLWILDARSLPRRRKSRENVANYTHERVQQLLVALYSISDFEHSIFSKFTIVRVKNDSQSLIATFYSIASWSSFTIEEMWSDSRDVWVRSDSFCGNTKLATYYVNEVKNSHARGYAFKLKLMFDSYYCDVLEHDNIWIDNEYNIN